MEKLSNYFENKRGLGVLGTADKEGKANAALYARPHFIDEATIAFIMADRLTHSNIQSNPKAVFLFVDDMEQYTGKRLYLTKTEETEDEKLIDDFRRKSKCPCAGKEKEKKKSFLVYFRINSVLPLVGDGE